MSTNDTPRILVIEDNEINRQLMLYLLRASGYEVLEATDGESGLTAVERERPDLIVCDIHLPTLDGFGVNRRLKNDISLRSIPIVAVTVLATVGDRDRILAAGFNGYVPKPFAPETFARDIAGFLPAARRRARGGRKIIETPVRNTGESQNESWA